MTEAHRTFDQQQEVESHAPYMKIFWTLLVFTVLEYLYATFAPVGFIALVVGLVAMALFKAALVGAYFMHLKFEGRWVYLLLVPAAFLAVVLVAGLCPDIAFHADPSTPVPDDAASLSLPDKPGEMPVSDRPRP